MIYYVLQTVSTALFTTVSTIWMVEGSGEDRLVEGRVKWTD